MRLGRLLDSLLDALTSIAELPAEPGIPERSEALRTYRPTGPDQTGHPGSAAMVAVSRFHAHGDRLDLSPR